MCFTENVKKNMPKNMKVRNLAWLRPLELIFGEEFTTRRAESEFDTFEPFFGLRFFFRFRIFSGAFATKIERKRKNTTAKIANVILSVKIAPDIF